MTLVYKSLAYFVLGEIDTATGVGYFVFSLVILVLLIVAYVIYRVRDKILQKLGRDTAPKFLNAEGGVYLDEANDLGMASDSEDEEHGDEHNVTLNSS